MSHDAGCFESSWQGPSVQTSSRVYSSLAYLLGAPANYPWQHHAHVAWTCSREESYAAESEDTAHPRPSGRSDLLPSAGGVATRFTDKLDHADSG
eukprot:5993048-Pyramimonas_sp.AAC.1